ncbi:MAG: hypothetical protein HC814_02760 [Rhodobacteraceae bacterium]|nr:hypothetical protein [Paracoccaceae bacterium]
MVHGRGEPEFRSINYYVAHDTPMKLRIATTSDADAIIAFDQDAASEPARVQFIHNQIKSSACYVAVIDGNVVAYAS